jgi:hypothetical protein
LTNGIVAPRLLRDLQKFFEKLRFYPFSRGLPRKKDLNDPGVAEFLNRAVRSRVVREDQLCLEPNRLTHLRAIQDAANLVYKKGWLHLTLTDAEDFAFIFPSPLHFW